MFVGYADPEWVWPQAVTLYTKNFDVIGFYRSHEENPLQHGMKVLCPPMGGELQSHVLWAWILYNRGLKGQNFGQSAQIKVPSRSLWAYHRQDRVETIGRLFMGKKSWLFLLVVLLVQGLLLPAMAADPWRIVVQTSPLRQSPQVFGKIISTLGYGTPVDILAEQAGWLQVKVSGERGWVHRTAVARRAMTLNAGKKPVDVAASKSELSLAGKGFNQQVEKAYREKNAQLDYAWVDRMALLTVDEEQLRQFVVEGQLSGGGNAN